jgi:hypothetical protein
MIVVGAIAVSPVPAVAQANAFGAPVRLLEATAKAEDKVATAPVVASESQPPAFSAPVPVAAAPAPLPPPMATVAAQLAPAAASTWRVEIADMNVRRVVERWSRVAGMQVIYESTKDVDVGATAAFSGTYEHALQQLFAAIESSEMPLRACLYANAVTRVIPRLQRCD